MLVNPRSLVPRDWLRHALSQMDALTAHRIWNSHLDKNAGYDEEWSPITVKGTVLIDGRRRIAAAVFLGIVQIEVMEYDPQSPVCSSIGAARFYDHHG